MGMIELVLWLAVTIFHESRGEPFVGQYAVAQVVLERVESSRWPNTVEGVVTQPMQFDGVPKKDLYLIIMQAKKNDRAALDKAVRVAIISVLSRPFFLQGGPRYCFFWAPVKRLERGLPASPHWAEEECLYREAIGNHVFCAKK